MKIRLIAIDLDGTLFDDNKCIPEENIAALKACVERGIEIVPATGRISSGLPAEVTNLAGVRYAIMANGALVADLKEDRIIAACRLDAETAAGIMQTARDSSYDVMYDVYANGYGVTQSFFYENVEHYMVTPRQADVVRKTRRVVPDSIAYVREQCSGVEKINLFFADMGERAQMRKRLAAIPGIVVTSSLPNNLEINAAGAEKGNALRQLREYLGLKREETMAFGDGENDLTMIREAGTGVAMGNGEETVKAEADLITAANNEAGVARAIKKYVLG